MDLYAAQRAFAADGQGVDNQIDLVLEPGADVVATRTALTAALPPGLEVQEPALRKEIVRDGVAAFQSMLTAFGLLAVVAGFVICYSRLGPSSRSAYLGGGIAARRRSAPVGSVP